MLTNPEQAAVRAIVTREGLDGVLNQVIQIAIADKKATAVATLGSAVVVTVSDWATPAAYVAQSGGTTLPSVIADIGAAWAARDQSKLGPLFIQLYGAAKAHLKL